MKVAYFTMDVESFYDTGCLKNVEYTKEDTYSGEEGIKLYTDLLDKYGIKATFFTLISSLPLAKPYLQDAVKNGHEIALHGLTHKTTLEMDDEEFLETITTGKRTLEDTFHTTITGYRAPYFGLKESQVDYLMKEGYQYDSSILNFHLAYGSSLVSLDTYTKLNSLIYKKDNIYEITPNTVKTFIGRMPCSGGGYIRLFPWVFVKHYLRKCIKQNDTFMFYVHPYELINKTPKIKRLDFVDRSFIRVGKKKYLKKIEFLIQELKKKGFVFKTLNEVPRA